MADNFNLINFPIKSNRITVTLYIKVHGKTPENTGSYTLSLNFKVLKNTLEEKDNNTVKGFLNIINKTVIERILPLLGKNVQITDVGLQAGEVSYTIPQYLFGTGQRNASLNPAMYFTLQPASNRNDFRLYLRGSCPTFHKQPLLDAQREIIEAFEMLFISVINVYPDKLTLRYSKNDETLISCNYRGIYDFPKKKKIGGVVRKRVKSVKKTGKTTKKFTNKKSEFAYA